MCFTQYIERANVPQLLKKKQSAKHKSAKKTAQRTSKYQLKHAEREATRKPSKKPAAPQKKQAQIHGKTAMLATLSHFYFTFYSFS